ncbi:MAG: hypothetical protein ACYDHY_06880 [Acidiferrobacterales bacterium]
MKKRMLKLRHGAYLLMLKARFHVSIVLMGLRFREVASKVLPKSDQFNRLARYDSEMKGIK